MSRRRPTLACLAPPEYQPLLVDGLAAAGLRVQFHRRPSARPTGEKPEFRDDPYGLALLAKKLHGEADGVLLVTPRNRSPQRTAPAPVVGGLPVGLLLSSRPDDLYPWLNAVRNQELGSPTWAVLSMWRDSYLSLGRRFTRWLRGTNPDSVEPWLADAISRYELCERLATGPRLALYVGHGRARGLSGYLGLRWHHLVEVREFAPCGTVICFACDTLKGERGILPFGCQWVAAGRAVAYFGSVDAVSIKANTRLAYEAGLVFADGRADRLAELLTILDDRMKTQPSLNDALKAFRTYRVIGNPLQPFF